MNVQSLKRRAKANTLEVEHILEAAIEKTPGLAATLSILAEEYKWPNENRLPDGSLVVPFGRWSKIAIVYVEGGFSSLVQLAKSTDEASFILALARQIKTQESVSFVLTAYKPFMIEPSKNIDISIMVASALNLMLSFKDAASISEEQAQFIESFLLTLYPLAHTEAARAIAILGLRGVGSESALNFVKNLPELSATWESSRQSTLKTLRKRVRSAL
ncbi:hypothetical protein [Methylotenera sp. N17]|uniref:hypothetical protein n=1 Tax=Methylotenera sp. N17 TaxID=1502761 RepID=UPI000646F3D3|nr:hypothetical protein [Methylotenera sp. N17]